MDLFFTPGLETPVLDLNNTGPYANEEFTARCSAPEEKGQLIFRFYQKFRTGNVEKLKQLGPTRNSWETTLVLRVVGDSLLYCDYEVNLVSGSRRSNRSAEIQVIVKGDPIKPRPLKRIKDPNSLKRWADHHLRRCVCACVFWLVCFWQNSTLPPS